MAEQEAAHRHETEKTIVNAQIQHSHRQFLEARFGQLCALVITLAALGGGVSTALQGHEIAGGVIGVGGIGGIVTTFILGRARSKPEQEPPPKSGEQKSKGTKQKKR